MLAPVLVLGIGNLLAGDDGLGWHAVQALTVEAADPHGRTLPPDVELLDGGTGGLALLPAISEAGALVIIDAVDVGAEPGTRHTLVGPDLYSRLVRLSVHQVGTADLLAAARLTNTLPNRVVLLGVQPATIATGVGLSPAVTAALPRLLAAVHDWCQQFSSGEAPLPRPKPA